MPTGCMETPPSRRRREHTSTAKRWTPSTPPVSKVRPAQHRRHTRVVVSPTRSPCPEPFTPNLGRHPTNTVCDEDNSAHSGVLDRPFSNQNGGDGPTAGSTDPVPRQGRLSRPVAESTATIPDGECLVNGVTGSALMSESRLLRSSYYTSREGDCKGIQGPLPAIGPTLTAPP